MTETKAFFYFLNTGKDSMTRPLDSVVLAPSLNDLFASIVHLFPGRE